MAVVKRKLKTMTEYPKKHTRKDPCKFCGVECGSPHSKNCQAIELLEKQGRGYKANKISKIKQIIYILKS